MHYFSFCTTQCVFTDPVSHESTQYEHVYIVQSQSYLADASVFKYSTCTFMCVKGFTNVLCKVHRAIQANNGFIVYFKLAGQQRTVLESVLWGTQERATVYLIQGAFLRAIYSDVVIMVQLLIEVTPPIGHTIYRMSQTNLQSDFLRQ